MDFLLGILGSLIASAVWAFLIFIFSKKIMKKIKRIFMTVFDCGAHFIFDSRLDIDYLEDLKKELEMATTIKIYTSRGKYLEDSPYRKILNNSQIEIKILLPSIQNNKWVEMRIQEVNKVDDKYTEEAFDSSLNATIRYLKTCKSNVILRRYDSIHIGRIILTDRVAYFSPYLKDTFGEDVAVYKYLANSTMYQWCERIFNETWENRYIATIVPGNGIKPTVR